MSALTRRVVHLLTAAIFCYGSAALAMPKAAEHEDAPVTSGADAAKPKRASSTATPTPTAKPTTAAKNGAHSGKSKSTHQAKSAGKPKSASQAKPTGKSKSASQAKPAAKAAKSATTSKGSRTSK